MILRLRTTGASASPDVRTDGGTDRAHPGWTSAGSHRHALRGRPSHARVEAQQHGERVEECLRHKRDVRPVLRPRPLTRGRQIEQVA